MGFNDMPISLKVQRMPREAYPHVALCKKGIQIQRELLSERTLRIIDEMKMGMTLKEAKARHNIGADVYIVFYKMVFGGLSKGSKDAKLGIQARTKYERAEYYE